MRNLQAQDIFSVARIIKQLDLKDAIKATMANNNDPESAGYELIYTIVCNASSKGVENELYALVGSLWEVSADEVKTMDIDVLLDKLLEYKEFVGTEKLKGFFERAWKLTK